VTHVIVVLNDKCNISTPKDLAAINPNTLHASIETIENPSRKTAILGALFNQWPEEMHAQVEEVKQHFNPKANA
jgi:hypothetical protein